MSDESTFTSTRTELAHRSGQGLDVSLIWLRCGQADSTVVYVCDWREGAYFEIPVEPHLALEAFYHPFAYRDFSRIDHADNRLAA